MKSTFVLAILFFASLAAVLSGCSRTPAVSSNSGAESEAGSAVKRTELTENALYAMDLNLEPQAFEAGRDGVLHFAVKDKQGRPFTKLQVVHEKLMHLLIVSDDLAFFDHVHPEQQPDGTFKLNYGFPAGGEYKLYADFTPENSPQIINVFDVSVSGEKRARTALAADAELTKKIDGLTVSLQADEPFQANRGATLNFSVKDAEGRPVTDLQPYLGAMAHFVVISEDTTRFLHVHAEEGETPVKDGHDGHGHQHGKTSDKSVTDASARPTIVAHTEFPTAGLYKLWAQFQRGGRVFTVPFVLSVAPADAPPKAESGEIPADAVRVLVTSSGYEPSSVSVKKGQPVRLAFIRQEAGGCGGEVVLAKQNIKKTLPVGQTVVIELPAQEAGEIEFACGMNMLKGKIVVAD